MQAVEWGTCIVNLAKHLDRLRSLLLLWVQLGAAPAVVPCDSAVGAHLRAVSHGLADLRPPTCIPDPLHGLGDVPAYEQRHSHTCYADSCSPNLCAQQQCC